MLTIQAEEESVGIHNVAATLEMEVDVLSLFLLPPLVFGKYPIGRLILLNHLQR